MSTRLLTAGLLAGLGMYVWGMFSHMALPLGDLGIQTLPDEASIATLLKDKIKEPGLYYFPFEKDMAKAEILLKERPRGLLTFTPHTVPFSMGFNLGVQLVNDLLLGLLLAWLLSKVTLPGLGEKLAFGVVLAVLATLSYLMPYWNWYGFPLTFVLAGACDALMATLIGTIIVTKWMRWV